MSLGGEPIVISGGGIGGLATAIALARRRIPSVVLERRGAFGEDGAGIQIGPNGTAILEALGVASRLKPAVAAPQQLRIFDLTDGNELATFPLSDWLASRHGAPYWTAHRRDLHAALLATAATEPLIVIETGAGVVAHRETAGRIAVESSDGRIWTGRALVVAEGLWSPSRGRLISAVPRADGRSAARTVIAADRVPAALHRSEVGLWMGPRAHVVHYPVRHGNEWALVLVVPEDDAREGWSLDIPASWVAERTAGCPELLHELLAAASDWRKWSLQRMPVDVPVAHGRTALIGDAAHPLLPFFAQGAVLALEDAMVLAAAMSGHAGDPATGIAAYADARRARVKRVRDASARNGRIYHLSGPAAAVRNLSLRLLPGPRFMASFDWLYGWKAPS